MSLTMRVLGAAIMSVGLAATARGDAVPADSVAPTPPSPLAGADAPDGRTAPSPQLDFPVSARVDLSLGAFADDEAAPSQASSVGDTGRSTAELAKAAQNPIANMISLPFQNNTYFDIGPGSDVANVLNIQPVIPFGLNDEWNLITRTIIPLIYLPDLADGLPEQSGGGSSEFGIGDMQFSAFLSPAKPTGLVWGAGPVLRLPTSTDASLGPRKWAAGPSVVALKSEGHWLFGALAQNVWSFAGSGDESVNQLLIQPFVNYNLADGWYLTTSPIITANWEANSDNRWTVPLGGGAGKIFRLGDQAMNASLQFYYNLEKPDLGPEWSIRFNLQLMFPR